MAAPSASMRARRVRSGSNISVSERAVLAACWRARHIFTLEDGRSRVDQPTGVGAVGCSRSGVTRGQRALLEADDAVGDVHSVGVDRYYR